jgi:hypothetical protein
MRPHAPAAGVPLVGMVEIEPGESAEPAPPSEPKNRARRRLRGGAGRRPTGRSRSRKKPEEPSSES